MYLGRTRVRDAAPPTRTDGECKNWLEIGPGAMGTLTKMVLEATDTNTVTAIEYVESSVTKVS